MHPTPPGLLRRLAAIVYDLLLLAAILMVAALPVVMLVDGAVGTGAPLTRLLFQIYLVTISFLFYGWFWTHGGQTLGMRTWRLRVVTRDGGPLSWADAAKRFGYAAFSWAALGLGFVWIVFDREHLAWHDRWSTTRLILLPKRQKQAGAATRRA